MNKSSLKPLFLCIYALVAPAFANFTQADSAKAKAYCKGSFIGTTITAEKQSEASSRAKAAIISDIISEVEAQVNISDFKKEHSDGRIETSSGFSEISQIKSKMTLLDFQQIESPKRLGNGEYELKGYVCNSKQAKPYLDSLKIINQRIGIQKISNSFCEDLYKTYSPKVMLFELLLKHFGEMDESRIADYKKIEKKCDDKRQFIQKGYVDFEEALDRAVAEISSKRGKVKTKIVIAEIYASSSNVASFITAELENRLTKVKTFSVESANTFGKQGRLGHMKFADAIEMGKYLKANIVIVGSFNPYAGFSHLKIRAIDVQNAKDIAMYIDKIRPNDAVLAGLIPNKLPDMTDEVLAYLINGEDLLREEKYDEAIKELDKALALKKNEGGGYFLRGSAYYDKGNYDLAIADLNAALKIDPEDYEALNVRGNAYADKGNHDRAIADYNTILRAKPNDTDALYNRGNVYYEKGDYDKAIADYSTAIKINPDDYESLNNRGNAYSNRGDNDRAIEDYSAALRIDPNNKYAFKNRGSAYYEKGNIDKAIKDFEAALRIDPDYENAKNDLEFARQEKAKGKR